MLISDWRWLSRSEVDASTRDHAAPYFLFDASRLHASAVAIFNNRAGQYGANG